MRLVTALLALATSPIVLLSQTRGEVKLPDTVLFGAAYYDEYTPTDRLDRDIALMKAAHITVVRIAESTWGTEEPEEGRFDFSHIDRVLEAMDRAGIKVIVGTPTYAIPTWLAREHPDVLAITPEGHNAYGPRQNMDLTNPHFRAAAEAMIVALVRHVKDHPSVIGYQLDNETKSYHTSGPNVQAAFVAQLEQQWHPAWGRYAAITRNQYGSGEVTYLGFMPSEILIEKLMTEAVTRAGLSTPAQQAHFPWIVRSGTLRDGHQVHYLLNYSPEPSAIPYGFPSGRDLLTERAVPANSSVQLGPWGFAIVEEDSVRVVCSFPGNKKCPSSNINEGQDR